MVSASSSKSGIVVKVSGVAQFVAEIGEQLAWLGTALRTASSSACILFCTPFLSDIPPRISSILHGPLRDISIEIKFKFESPEENALNINGQCWYGMFSSAVVAHGFPIPARMEEDTGLEMPLNLMAELVNSRQVDVFYSKIFIKGFSAMLVPTHRCEDVLNWHFIYNTQPEQRISYLDCRATHVDVTISELERMRHVVGWCSAAVCEVGMLPSQSILTRTLNCCYVPQAH